MVYVYAFICHRLTNPLVFTVKYLLESEKSRVIIHIDQKASAKERSSIALSLGQHENLVILPRDASINVRWGGFTQIQVMLLLMKEALKYNFKYFSLLSGDDIPIQSNSIREANFEIAYKENIEFIGHNPDNNAYERLYIDYPNFMYNKDHSIKGKIKRYIYIRFKSKFFKKDLSHLPKLYKGSQWFTLTDKSVKYIFDYIEGNSKYIESFKKSLCGDEVFFQTIIFNNDELRNNIYGFNENMEDCAGGGRYIDWTTGPDFPRTLDDNDIVKIRESSSFFARKIKPDATREFMEQLLISRK